MSKYKTVVMSICSSITMSDFNKICRTCMEPKTDFISISSIGLLTVLETCTSVKMDPDNRLPDNICAECVEKTNETCNFVQLCNASEKLLLEILHQSEEIENVPDIGSPVELKLESDDNFDEEMGFTNSDDDFNISTDPVARKLSIRKAKITWLMSLGQDNCDTTLLLCKICNKNLVNLSSLARHMETHDSNRKISETCNICGKGFYEKGNYLRHMLRHKREAKYKCSKCSKSYYELNILATHLQKVHNIEPINCPDCDKKFYVEEQLQIHVKKHKNQFEYNCNHCGKGYFQLRRLNEHLLTHEKTYLCEICNKTYKNHSSLNKHNYRYHKSVQERQVCQICGATVLHIKAHMLIHNGARLFNCDECNKAFIHRSDLVAHCKRKHRDDNEPQKLPYLCNICGKGKLSNAALQQHIIHAHTTEKTQKCQLCPKVFKTENAMKSHVRYSHKDVRNFKCDTCGKGFYTNAILRSHVRTHTGEKPFTCHICGRAFGKNSTLKTHMKIHRTADFD